MQLWLIPILPFLGFLLNGLFGRRLSKPVINAIAVGSVLLSFLWVVKTLNALGAFSGGLEETYKEHYYTWIQSGMLNIGVDFAIDRLTAVMLMIVTGVGFLIHVYAVGYMAHEGGYYRFFAYLNLFMFFMLMLVLGANFLLLVRRMGRRGTVQLPADRLLFPRKVRHRRRQQGVHRKPHRRFRVLAGDIPGRHTLRHARLRNSLHADQGHAGRSQRRYLYRDFAAAAGRRNR